MPLIYSQATVTITASRANRVEEGFLQNRPRMAEDIPSLIFELPFRCSNNQLGSVVFLPRVERSKEPLDIRAWALQERFLSLRVLEYGSLQTRWMCKHSLKSEDPTDGYKVSNGNMDGQGFLLNRVLKAVLQASDPSLAAPDNLRELRRKWCEIVAIYTRRALTLGTDRLPAISGIAAQFGSILCDEYKSGLWKSTMECELLWRITPKCEPALFRPDRGNTRPRLGPGQLSTSQFILRRRGGTHATTLRS
jgi:hypothetical protein